jgi:hypothetical protein
MAFRAVSRQHINVQCYRRHRKLTGKAILAGEQGKRVGHGMPHGASYHAECQTLTGGGGATAS